ncbi:hypothetical protein [Hydrogenophaga sp.]|uniref:hypothetical protein n=1 Tax=Hydrogenophaga sp. TaxID=1904254 RepID=UPI003D0C67E1
MFTYMIYGVLRGSSEGLMFHSCVPDLGQHPELWADECPFPINSVELARIEIAPGVAPSEVANLPRIPYAT